MKFTGKLCSLVVVLAAVGTAPIVISGCKSTQSAGTQWDDSTITARVKSKLIGSDRVAAHNIDVNTEEGVVYLLGRVKTAEERSVAERLAKETEGVHKVVNHLEVGDEAK